ncbi:ac88 [Malacosoma neustria nucleopolyhedrovirus]|uniref:ac88 n=1 Tax=Malacosoma neustria nuclear polyhedrosis virus TaxID=38012 RepID=UPI000E3581A8|nr:ac88 [Malacosoma neustria nucleopolyhedrovirus]AUF81594.1 ac88 [Malacosoma neustria nucleopolyhedrovirus]
MSTVGTTMFECNICCSVFGVHKEDTICVVPLLVLRCSHHICVSCAEAIKNELTLVCPMCRQQNVVGKLLSISKSTIHYVNVPLNNLKKWAMNKNNNIDIGSFVADYFKNDIVENGDIFDKDDNEHVDMYKLELDILKNTIQKNKIVSKKLNEKIENQTRELYKMQCIIKSLKAQSRQIIQQHKEDAFIKQSLLSKKMEVKIANVVSAILD